MKILKIQKSRDFQYLKYNLEQLNDFCDKYTKYKNMLI